MAWAGFWNWSVYCCRIRRKIPPLPPRPSTAGRRRDLALILADTARGSTAPTESTALHNLLGRGGGTTPPRVREFVTDTALGALAEGFGAEAVAIARIDGADQAAVSSRLPPSWDESSSATFELYGQLWGLLERRGLLVGQAETASSRFRSRHRPDAAVSHRVEFADRAMWLGWQPTGQGDLAAAVVRNEPFSDDENAVLTRLMRSVAFALGGEPSTPASAAEISALLLPLDEGWRAEAFVESRGKRRRAIAEAPESELAVARAAAKLCRVPAEVSFAGRTDLDGMSVTLVVVHDRNHAPFLGLAVTEPDRVEAAAEAVFSAVSAMDGPLEAVPAIRS